MTYRPPIRFNAPWSSVAQCWLDVESTGIKPGKDRVVEVACVRFEGGKAVDQYDSLINPGMPIPTEATAIHGITDDDVRDAPTLADFFNDVRVTRMLADAQPGSYNSMFDRLFVLREMQFDGNWPWLDTLPLVRFVDRYVKGSGRHKLNAACKRHGIELPEAHRALADAKAAGELCHVLVPQMAARICFSKHIAPPIVPCIGDLLRWMRIAETEEWARFHGWLSEQPEQAP